MVKLVNEILVVLKIYKNHIVLIIKKRKVYMTILTTIIAVI